MKLPVVSAVFLFAGLASALGRHDSTSRTFKHRRGPVEPKSIQSTVESIVDGVESLAGRVTSMLINPAAQPDLPTLPAAKVASKAAGLDLDDIQGDVLIGMKKNQQLFYFFTIADAKDFKSKLSSDIHPLITSTSQVLNVSTEPTTLVNIAFSQTGLTALNVTDSLGDDFFTGGQFQDLNNLGDPGSTNWVPQFTGTDIHGVLLFASDTVDNINATVSSLESSMGSSMTKVYSLQAAARPGDEAGHEHFGYLDGISNPAVTGFTTKPMPGQAVVAPGTILVGEKGDSAKRPAWAKGGAFLVFRQLKQLVPEYNKFLIDNPIVEEGLTAEQGSALLGARMVGRWKSGAPVDLASMFDDPALGADPTRNNDFTYGDSNQTRCPFSAHIRKTRPRADFSTPEDTIHHIMRAGIPYGPEVSTDEADSNTTSTERGLAFVSYQSSIGDGFRFLQQTWANDADFINSGVGVDPIVGALAGAQRVISGLDPTDSTRELTMTTDFVVSRGGEYFFSPSLSAIANKLSA
ncbi:DyP-type peroxidase [Mycena polygramma]|nr:DyP-type peroxidase [Mycena polygramma]